MVVAVDQHLRHDAADRLATDLVIERAHSVIDLREVERRNCDLDGACHREGRVALDAKGFAGVEVERRDADVGRLVRDQRLKLFLEPVQRRRRRRERRLREQRKKRDQ